jgi:HK97 gp10 family phage protein
MGVLTLDMVGFAETQAALISMRDVQVALVHEAVHEAADAAKDMMDSLTPVATGYLLSRNQVVQTIADSYARVYQLINDADYAAFVVFGTVHTPANDFMTPAFVYGRMILEQKVAAIATAL